MYAPHVSLSTIDRYLCQNNYRTWLAKKRPKLEDRHVFQRLQWALQHKDWTHEQWEGVIWSDECSVEKSDSRRQMWVIQQPPEEWFKHCIAPKRKGKGIFLMVWGHFWGRNRGTFCPVIVKSVNKSVYVMLLEYLLLPVHWQKCKVTIGRTMCSLLQASRKPLRNAQHIVICSRFIEM